jgi:hypothetical protein
MRPASNSLPGSGSLARRAGLIGLLGGLALGVAVLTIAAAGSARPEVAVSMPVGASELFAGDRAVVTALQATGVRRLGSSNWQGRAFTASTGESVTVYVSDAYPDVESVGQHWADFFASLVHSSELASLITYVVGPTEITSLCGDPRAIGCYGSSRLVIVGEQIAGVAPEEVARHEYGHHIAANRLNPPWQAVDWGPKRWGSAAGVCTRVKQGTAFPGDEGFRYQQNPGEAFAESYRILNDQRAGVTALSWNIIDPSFYPDAAALHAIEQDVVDPWKPPAPQIMRSRFAARGKQTWTARLATPLDGELVVGLSLPRGAPYDLTLTAAVTGTVLAKGQWSDAAEKRLTYTVCGERSLLLDITRRGPAGPFSLQIAHA